MIFRLEFIVAASIAAYAFQQLYDRSSKLIALDDLPENGEATSEKLQNESEDEENHANARDGLREVIAEEKEEEEEEEEKEDVKLINGVINPCTSSKSNFEDERYPEMKSLLSGEIDTPLPADKYDTSSIINAAKESVYENDTANNVKELEELRYLVKELEAREMKLEGDLLQYHSLKEQELSISELQKQLKIKAAEIDMLKITINSLQAERKKLQEELSQGAVAKELEMARKKILQLGTQIQLEANQTKGQLLLLKQQVTGFQAKEDESLNKDSKIEKNLRAAKELEMEVMELKRKNKELQHDKRELVIKLDAAESKINSHSNKDETENVANVREEANNLRHANDDLVKQVEGLQMNRFSEVEELVYLRWVNACLRFELRNYQTPPGKTSARDLNESLSPKSQERAKQLLLEYAESERGGGDTDTDSNFDNTSVDSEDFDNASVDSSMSRFSSLSKKPSLIQKLKKWGKNKDGSSTFSSPTRSNDGSPMNQKKRGPLESLILRNASDGVAITSFGTADHNDVNLINSVSTSFQLMSKSVEGFLDEKYPAYRDAHKLALEREKQLKERAEKARAVKFDGGDSLKEESNKLISLPPKLALIKEKKPVIVSGESNEQSCDNKGDSQTVSKIKLAEIEKRAPRIPRPPPKLSDAPVSNSSVSSQPPSLSLPPPPPPPRPPPPPGSLVRGARGDNKVHQAPELDEFYQSLMKREARKETSPSIASSTDTSNARSNMAGEIENRSTFLMAAKADVETQGDFVHSLATEVRAASFTKIEDLVAFVNWLDEELSFLVHERAVLKHFDWLEAKADALREATFEYQDLIKLEKQVSSFSDNQNLPCEAALKKMYKLLEKVEQSVYALLRTRDMAVSKYKEFGIPTDWLLDSGTVGKIKISSVQLARKYMKRVATVLDAMNESEKEPNKEFLILQGVRFAFRVHQFAGGFDAESMKAFEELRRRAQNLGGEASKSET